MNIKHIISLNLDSNQTKNFAPFINDQLDNLKRLINFEILLLNNKKTIRVILRNIFTLRNNTCKDSIIHIHFGGYFSFFVILFSKSKNVIVSYMGTDINGKINIDYKSKIYNFILPFLNLFIFKKCKQIIIKNEGMILKIPEKYHNKINILPNGVNLNFFKPLEDNRKKYGWKKSDFVILFNLRRGRKIDTVKNFELAEKTINHLNKTEKNIVFYPFQNMDREEIPNLLNSADCLLLTSFFEGSPNIVKESMACNLPVVSVNCGDVFFLLNNVKNSYVSKSYSHIELSELLKKVIKNNCKSDGRKHIIEKNLDIKNNSVKLKEIYSKMII